MQKLFNRILSFLMAIIMMLSLTTSVFASTPTDSVDSTSQVETADPPAEENDSADDTAPADEIVPTEETPVDPVSETTSEPGTSEPPSQQPETPTETQVEPPAENPTETPTETQNTQNTENPQNTPAASQPDPVPVAETEITAPTKELPRLTALYEGHRVRYYDSAKQPLPEHASLHMGEIDEDDIPFYLQRAAHALGLESCGMYLYFIADPLIEDAVTAEVLHYNANPDDPDDRMTVEVTLIDDADMSDEEKAQRLNYLREIHIDDLQVILLGATWEEDTLAPYTYDEETGVIRFTVETVGGFILLIPDWDSAVYPEEDEIVVDGTEIPTNPEVTEPQNSDAGTENPSGTNEDNGTQKLPEQPVTENPTETTAADADVTSTPDVPPDPDAPPAPAEQTVTASGADYSVSLTYTADANIPEGSVFELSELPDSGIVHQHLTDSVANTLNASTEDIVSVTFVDVDIKNDGESVTPNTDVSVSIAVDDSSDSDTVTQVVALGTENQVLNPEEDTASYTNVTDSLTSTYAIVRVTKQVTLKTSDDQTWQITVSYDRTDPAIPENVELTVTELLKGTPEYDAYVAASAAATGADPNSLSFAKAFDICLIDPATGAECQPTKEVQVSIQLLEEDVDASAPVDVVHFGDEPEKLDAALNADNAIEFAASGFSVFVVMQVIKEQVLTASDGNTYRITVTYDKSSGIPEDAELLVTEIREGDEGYYDYVAQSAEKVGADPESLTFARAFDITLKNLETGETYQPSKDVKVSIALLNEELKEDANIDVIHFGDEVEALDCALNNEAIEFETNGFSVYVVIEHEGEKKVVEPRVEFHFLDHDDDGVGVTENGITYYTTDPYSFNNKAQDQGSKTQTSLIVHNGDILESIEAPLNMENKYFYGWYTVVRKAGDTGNSVAYYWPDNTKRVELDNTVSVSAVQDASGAVTSVTWTVNGVSETVSDVEFIDADGCAHVYLAPIYENYHFVNFHLGASGESTASNLMARKLVVLGNSQTTSILISDIQAPSIDPVHLIFVGWERDVNANNNDVESWETIRTVDDDGNVIDTSLTVGAETIDLYPVFVEIRWINYNVGVSHNGASYLAPKFMYSSDDTDYPISTLDTAARVGYTFGGWFLAEDGDHNGTGTQIAGTNGSIVAGPLYGYVNSAGSVQITTTKGAPGGGYDDLAYKVEGGRLYVYKKLDSLTVYAKWVPNNNTSYYVYFWQQNANDDGYTFTDYAIVTGVAAGTTTNVTDSTSVIPQIAGGGAKTISALYTSDHFTLNTTNHKIVNQEINGDNSTVVNVYYDRESYTLRFYFARIYSYNGRTYIQVNNNNDGFNNTGYSDANSLTTALTLARNGNNYFNDYQRIGGQQNTWRDVASDTVTSPEQLVSPSYLAASHAVIKSENHTGNTTIFTTYNSNSVLQRSQEMTYYYIEVKVKFDQEISQLWPKASDFLQQTMSFYNYNDHDNDVPNYRGHTIDPIFWGSMGNESNVNASSTASAELIHNTTDNIGYYLLYWRAQSTHKALFKVYFSALEGETYDDTFDEVPYVLQDGTDGTASLTGITVSGEPNFGDIYPNQYSGFSLANQKSDGKSKRGPFERHLQWHKLYLRI